MFTRRLTALLLSVLLPFQAMAAETDARDAVADPRTDLRKDPPRIAADQACGNAFTCMSLASPAVPPAPLPAAARKQQKATLA